MSFLSLIYYSYSIYQNKIKETIQVNDAECDSIDDEDSDDLHRYKEVLYAIGEFARISLEHSLPTLAKLLDEKYIQLLSALSKQAQCSPGTDLSKQITDLSEDLHWILLISGFALFEVGSEQPSISAELMAYSIRCSKFVDQALVQQLFSNTLNKTSKEANKELIELRLTDYDTLDPVVRLVLNAFQLTELENHMFSMNLVRILFDIFAEFF